MFSKRYLGYTSMRFEAGVFTRNGIISRVGSGNPSETFYTLVTQGIALGINSRDILLWKNP